MIDRLTHFVNTTKEPPQESGNKRTLTHFVNTIHFVNTTKEPPTTYIISFSFSCDSMCAPCDWLYIHLFLRCSFYHTTHTGSHWIIYKYIYIYIYIFIFIYIITFQFSKKWVKVVGQCMDKGNNKKNVKKYYFNKRVYIIDN